MSFLYIYNIFYIKTFCVLSCRASLRWAVPELDSRGRQRRIWRLDNGRNELISKMSFIFSTNESWGCFNSHWLCVCVSLLSQETSRLTGTEVSRWAPGTAAVTAARAVWEDTVITVSVSSASHTFNSSFQTVVHYYSIIYKHEQTFTICKAYGSGGHFGLVICFKLRKLETMQITNSHIVDKFVNMDLQCIAI